MLSLALARGVLGCLSLLTLAVDGAVQWSYQFPSPTSGAWTPRSNAVALANASTLILLGGETAAASASFAALNGALYTTR